MYPHAIVFDFEAFMDRSSATKTTKDLSYTAVHIPFSVSVSDTLNQEPTFIDDEDPQELLSKFLRELTKRTECIKAAVKHFLNFGDTTLLTTTCQKKYNRWVSQVLILGFNSGNSLIKNHFVPAGAC